MRKLKHIGAAVFAAVIERQRLGIGAFKLILFADGRESRMPSFRNPPLKPKLHLPRKKIGIISISNPAIISLAISSFI